MSNVEVASQAYAYFYPIVENLKTFYFASVWPHTSDYQGSVNVFKHATKLADWTSASVVAPNNDTLYSVAWLDLEDQPLILNLPEVPTEPIKRYYSMQIVDGFTFNVKIISPRTTGSWSAVQYLILGPSYNGPIPSTFDTDHIIRSSSRFTMILGRTALYGPEDIDNVKNIQAGYMVSPMQDRIGKQATSSSILPPFPFINKMELASNSPEPQLFFTYANFIMKYIKIPTYEADLYQQFSQLQIGPGASFNGQYMTIRDYGAISVGIKEGSKKIDLAPFLEKFGNSKDGWSGAINPPIFGPEEVMKERYLTRAYAARYGLYGVDPEEAYYLSTSEDIDGENFDSMKSNYTITFAKGELPPVKDGGFWSSTMYRMPQKLLVHNVNNRYSIGDRTPGLVFGSDGSLKLYIQKDKPSTPEGVANWLPAPDPVFAGYDSGSFSLTVRIYWPTPEALSDPYFPPGVIKQSQDSHL